MLSDRPSPFFVGNHPAIDFLNTIAMPQGTEIDWLVSGEDLITWLEQARLIDSSHGKAIRSFDKKALENVVHQARNFRNWLRRFVLSRMGKPLQVTPATLAPVNQLLLLDNSFTRIQFDSTDPSARRLLVHRTPRCESPDELLLPIAEVAADLICNHDFQLIRACEGVGCILIFLDCTKAHSRRWCSMAVCGNRSKVATHRAKDTRQMDN